MSRTDDIFRPALQGKRLPVLTLDHNWHKLFAQGHMTPEIEALEKEVNELLKKQGKANSELKSVRALKKKLMDEIVDLADQLDLAPNDKLQKDLDDHKRLVEDCNTKLDELRDSSLDLPREIDQANFRLMLKTMEVCYGRLGENVQQINAYDEWITGIRAELKKNLIHKQELERDTFDLYTYMHDIFGPDVIDIFDMHYHPEKFAPKQPT